MTLTYTRRLMYTQSVTFRQKCENRDIACAATARRRIAAACRVRLHALGPWPAGDGSAAGRPLRQPPRPPQASPSSPNSLTAMGTWAAMLFVESGVQRDDKDADAGGRGTGRW